MNPPNSDRQQLENFIILETLTQPEDANNYQIYRCQHRTLNSLTLLKCIPASTIQQIGDIASLESAALQKINSPNVIKIQSYFLSNQMHCLLFENCDSNMNQVLIENNYRLTEQQAIRYMLEIVNGLQTIHQAQIIHRDLQMKNIYISQNKPKIANFGFARYAFDQTKSKIYPLLGISAPECFTLQYRPSYFEDIFSLGSIFYILLTGSLPFDCSNTQNYITSIQNQILNIDAYTIQTTKESIIKLIRAMMNFNPNERPSLNAIKNVLCQSMNHEQIQIRKVNPLSLMMIATIKWSQEKINQLAKQILYLDKTADEFAGKTFYNILKIQFPRLMLCKRCYFELDELIKVVKSKNENNVFISEIKNLETNISIIKQKLEQLIYLCKVEPRLKYDDIQGWQNELDLIQNDNFYDIYEKAMTFLINHMKRTEIPFLQKQNQMIELQAMLILIVHIQICSENFDEKTVQQEFEGANLRTISQLKEIAKIQ